MLAATQHTDQWKLEHVEEAGFNICDLVDAPDEEHLMEDTAEQKYLGDILTSTGSNKSNIASRRGKGLGVVKQILPILDEVTFGQHKFEIAVMLRNSLFVNSVLCNSEVF